LESIPCDPCGYICPIDAIRKDSLTSPPVMDWDLCVGCIKCVPICPGLAIFVQWIDKDYGYVTLPYEQLPNPQVGDVVILFDREGKEIGKGEIVLPMYEAKGRSNPLWCVTVKFPNSRLARARTCNSNFILINDTCAWRNMVIS
jgi:Fe-S-cluster-containing hydrogenase component 2